MSVLWHGLLNGLAQLLSAFYNLVPNYGVAIVFLTVAIRIVLLPLAVKQARMMETSRKQQESLKKIQPELKRLREKHKDDKQKLYEESKKLQDEHGVNPLAGLAGCLPTLLQLPILFAMYRVVAGCSKFSRTTAVCPPKLVLFPKGSAIRAAFLHHHVNFLGMNLTRSATQVQRADGLLHALPYFLLLLLMAGSTWYSQKQATKVTAVDPQMQQTQKILAFMPVMFLFLFLNSPSGLALYWVVTNIWTIGQQAILFKRYIPQAAGGLPTGKPGKSADGSRVEPKLLRGKGQANGKVAQEADVKPSQSKPQGDQRAKTNGAGAKARSKNSKKRKRSGRR